MRSFSRRAACGKTKEDRPDTDRPIPIALVITELDIGGAERALFSLATRLDPARWRPSVLCLGPEAALSGPLRERGIETECLDVPRDRPIEAVGRLARALARRRPSLAQSFLFHANVATRLAAVRAGVPWVVGGVRVAEREKRWHLVIERLTMPLSSGVVCVSEGVAQDLRRRTRWPLGRMTVIPNAVELAPIDRAEPTPRAALDVPESAHLALFVGRITRQKDVASLIEAAEVVARDRPDWYLAIAGEGPSRERLEARTRANPLLGRRVRWLGFRQDVPGLLKAADLLVLPSRWEGMPNVVLEAMAAGRPVVATRVEGCEELIVEGETGWLVPPGQIPPLVRSLVSAASDPEECRRRGARGRARVSGHYAPEAVVLAYERLWLTLINP